MLGAFANVLLFLCGLIWTGVVAAFVFAYAAHCLLVVVTDTASGQDEVRWPGGPVLDWLGQSLQVAIVLALWLVPAGFLSRALAESLFPESAGARFLALAVPGVWLFFPVGILSSLSAGSPFVVVRPSVVGRLLRVFPSLIVFYAVTAAVMWGTAAVWGLALFTEDFYLVPVAAAAGATSVLVYARLLGRIAWLTGQLDGNRKSNRTRGAAGVRKRAKAKSEGRRSPVTGVTKMPNRAPRATPRKAPDPPEPAKGPGLTPYGSKAEPVEPYALAKDVQFTPPADETAGSAPQDFDDLPMPALDDELALPRERPNFEPSELEVRLLDRTPSDSPPALPMISGVYTFPWYQTSLKAWSRLLVGGIALGFGLRFLILHAPR